MRMMGSYRNMDNGTSISESVKIVDIVEQPNTLKSLLILGTRYLTVRVIFMNTSSR